MRKKLRLGAGVAAVAAVFATGAFAGSSPGANLRATSPGASTVSGRCSKAAAVQLANRLHLGNAGYTTHPVAQILCGAFVGPRSQAMVFSLTIPSCGGTAWWVVFRWTGRAWQLVLKRNNGADLAAVGSDIRETMGVLGPGDPHCFPSAAKSRIWHWNGTRFTASPWKVSLATLHLETFLSPDRKVGCAVNSDQVWCATNPPGPGVHFAVLHRNGDVRLCDATPNDICLQNAITSAPVLRYGQQNELRGFRCTSEEKGITCMVIAGTGKGKGFLINAAGATRVGR